MGAFLERRRRRAPALPAQASTQRAAGDASGSQWSQVQFVPARWLVLALSIVWALLSPGPVGKVGLASLAWSVAPRRLRIAAAGFALFTTVVFVGAIAAVALLVLELA